MSEISRVIRAIHDQWMDFISRHDRVRWTKRMEDYGQYHIAEFLGPDGQTVRCSTVIADWALEQSNFDALKYMHGETLQRVGRFCADNYSVEQLQELVTVEKAIEKCCYFWQHKIPVPKRLPERCELCGNSWISAAKVTSDLWQCDWCGHMGEIEP